MRLKKLTSFSLIAVLLCSLTIGCSNTTNQSTLPSNAPDVTSSPIAQADDKYSVQAAFDMFTDKIFTDEVLDDSITLNYTLANPENYGITNYTPTFGNYSLESKKNALKERASYYDELQKFDKLLLSDDQLLTYTILSYLLAPDADAEKYILYEEILSPTTGTQAQLPILLAEYNFYDKDDITNYLNLLTKLPDYFKQIVQFEQEKSKAGLFMSDVSADDIINQCKQFIFDKENNYLIGIFDEKIATFDYSEEERSQLSEQNKKAVLECVIPAYESLIDGLTALKGTGLNDGGLANFADGKEYYQRLVKATTGSSRTVEDINALLDATIQQSMGNIYNIALKDTNVLAEADAATYPMTDPKEILDYLKKSIETDFPKLDRVNCNIKYVHKSLEDNLSPAFYLTPPIDNYSQNNIYINGSSKYDLSDIFTTIAHEGYPGHLYQTVYYHQQQPSLIRNVIDFGGYTEGWATYVELYSYGISGLKENVSNLLRENLIAVLCIYAKLDIGVNYYGWDYTKSKEFLAQFSIQDEDAILTMYHSMIEEPANYMKYTLGYLEFQQLKDRAQQALGDSFVLKDFHEFLLDMGPTPFDIMNTYLTSWIDKQLTK